MPKSVVRVGVLNNFNCTPKEYKQLNNFAHKHPDKSFFINCNINTPKLHAINDRPYKAVITLNPNITDNSFFKLGQVDLSKVAFVRIKYVPNKPTIVNLIKLIASMDIPVVITMQRFNGKKSVSTFGIKNYKFSYNRYRLTENAKKVVEKLASNTKNVYICDRSGGGCKECGLCAKLTVGENLPVYSLNLSTSGLCPFSCLDCYAKTMQKFVVGCGHNPIAFDVIQKNMKQKGSTKHIKDNLNKKTERKEV